MQRGVTTRSLSEKFQLMPTRSVEVISSGKLKVHIMNSRKRTLTSLDDNHVTREVSAKNPSSLPNRMTSQAVEKLCILI